MERIDHLLEKYFQGTTTLQDENELKTYFSGNRVRAEHQIYQSLFDAFAEEKKIKPTAAKPRKTYRITRWAMSMSGVAAAAVFAIAWFLATENTETYIVINGNKVNDAAYACQYADAKINKAFAVLGKGMQPVQHVEKVRQSFTPFQKVEKATKMINKQEVIVFELLDKK